MKAETEFLNQAFWDEQSAWLSVAPEKVVDETLLEFLTQHPETSGRGLLGFQTSGSTGEPKWVILEKTAFLASARAVNAHLEISSQDHWMIPLPTHHVAGFAILARCFLSGASYEKLATPWDAETFVNQLAAGQCTLCSLVPTQVYDVVKLKLAPPASLRAVLVGGGGMNASLREAAIQLGWPVLQSYGMTEASSGIATEPLSAAQSVLETPLEVLPIWRLSLSEKQTLVVQGEALAKGYAHQDLGAWAWSAIPSEGLITRDRVDLYEQAGRSVLKFLGRDAAFVKVKGELLHLGAIQSRWEALSLAQGYQGDAVVISLPDERRDEKLVLVVTQGSDTAGLQRMMDLYHEESRPLEKIHELRWVHQIPRSELGKVRLETLKSKFD